MPAGAATVYRGSASKTDGAAYSRPGPGGKHQVERIRGAGLFLTGYIERKLVGPAGIEPATNRL
jgi:hypothetical protein